MAYDVRRLRAIELGEADLPDRDAVVEIIVGTVETMVRGYPAPSPRQEERYRTQLRALRAVLARLDVDVELPGSLRGWLDDQPARSPALLIRATAERLFSSVIEAVDAIDAIDDPQGLSRRGRKSPQPSRLHDSAESSPSKRKRTVAETTSSEVGQASSPSPNAAGRGTSHDQATAPGPGEPGRRRTTTRRRAVLGWTAEHVVLEMIIALVAGFVIYFATRSSPSPQAVGIKSASDSGARVTLAQGAATAGDYLFSVTLQGFPAHTQVPVTCHDAEYPQGFGQFTLMTNRAGAAANGRAPCHSPSHGSNWVIAGGVGSNKLIWKAPPAPNVTYAETAGGQAHTWTNYRDAGGEPGPVMPSGATVQVACRVAGFGVADGNTWWYRIASSPWRNQYYVSADAFYNNGQTSGTLRGTPFLDPSIPVC